MSTAASSYYFRRRTMGRAASPPTWACYEQIPYDDDDDSDSSDSCSEDDDEYPRTAAGLESSSDSEDKDHSADSGAVEDPHDLNMDIDEEGIDGGADGKGTDSKKDVKGKQRAIEMEPESKRPHRRRQRPPVYTLRPILTIQKSQGFVWNQDLFVPPYIKDRWRLTINFCITPGVFVLQITDVASTSPPNSKGFISTSASSINSGMTDYEVEVVEIRVKEGDLDFIMP